MQAYVFMAKQRAARMARLLGQPEIAIALDQQAEALRERFEAAFWCEEISTYALPLLSESPASASLMKYHR